MYTDIYIYTYTYIYICIYIYVQTCVYIYIYTYIRTYIFEHIRICLIHIHTYMLPVCFQLRPVIISPLTLAQLHSHCPRSVRIDWNEQDQILMQIRCSLCCWYLGRRHNLVLLPRLFMFSHFALHKREFIAQGLELLGRFLEHIVLRIAQLFEAQNLIFNCWQSLLCGVWLDLQLVSLRSETLCHYWCHHLYICRYVNIRAYVYGYMYVCLYIQMYINMVIHMCIYVCVFEYICIYVCSSYTYFNI